MANLFGIGLSGLNAAQAGLSTASNNISNVNTPGYTRERVELQENVAASQGNGVLVAGVRRNYAQFLTAQLNAAQSRTSATHSHLSQISQIDNLLGDSKAGLAPLMQKFFSAVNTVAGDPSDTAARQALLGSADTLAGQFNSFAGYLSDMGKSLNSQLESSAKQVNNYASQIADLNHQITLVKGRTGSPPNKLLDQRDQLVSSLRQVINADVTVTGDGSYDIAVAGQSLVDASGAHSLTVVDSAADPDQRVIAYQGAGGATRELADSQISGGSLGGLLAFRDNSLEPAQLKLDQLAHGFAAQVNKVHENGKDLNGGPGGVFFTINDPKKAQPGQPKTYENASNTGSAKLSASFIPGDADKVKASNYQVIFDGSQYQVTRLTDNTTVASGNAGDMLSFDGLNVSTPGTPPATGDSFLIKPLSNAAGSFDVAIKNPAKIAAGQGGGVGDNTNAKALADLENAKTIEGNRSFNDDYAQLVADIGNKTQTLQTNSDAEKTLTDELTQSQQSVSGVNLNEESVNLVYYQQMYQANAQVIRTASTLFDTLLNAI